MENKNGNVNELVMFIAATAMKPLLSDGIWQCYGYKRRPRHGNIWNKIFPKTFELENFISKEILTMGLIDILNGIKKSEIPSDTKLLVAVGVVDRLLSTTKHLFTLDLFMQNLFSTYASFLKSDKSKLHEPIIVKATDILSKKDFAKFTVGTIKLLTDSPLLEIERSNDFLLKSDYIKDVVEESSKEGEMKIFMTGEVYKKYAPLLETEILNS